MLSRLEILSGELIASITSFQKIVDAPSSLIELEKDTPEINEALEFLDSNGLKADEETLRMLGRAIMYLASFDATIVKTSPLPPGTNKEFLLAIQADKEMAALIFNDLVPYLQKRALEDHYQMSPDRMLDVMNRYGPLDWRHGDEQNHPQAPHLEQSVHRYERHRAWRSLQCGG